MIRLLFAETDASDRHLYEKYTVKFYFSEDIYPSPSKKHWSEQTSAMGGWCIEYLEKNTFAVLNDKLERDGDYHNMRFIEYGFKNEEDAILFKLTWV